MLAFIIAIVCRCQSYFAMSSKFFALAALAVAKKTLQFNIRMSEEQRTELEEMCRRRRRPFEFPSGTSDCSRQAAN